jgi:subtilisin family serine protease
MLAGANTGVVGQELFPEFEYHDSTGSLNTSAAIRSTRAPLPDSALELDETTIQSVSFDYVGGPYSSDFIRLVADSAALSPHTISAPVSLAELVTTVCGDTHPQTVSLFEMVLDENGLIQRTGSEMRVVSSDGTVPVPPCLPQLRLETVMRLVLPGDRIVDYYEKDQSCEGCVKMRWSGGDRSILSANARFVNATAPSLDADVAEITSTLERLRENTPPDHLTQSINSRQYSISSENDKNDTDPELAGALADDLYLAVLTGTPTEVAIGFIVERVEALRPGSGENLKAALLGFARAFIADEASRLSNVARLMALRDALSAYRPDGYDGMSLAYAETSVVLRSDLLPRPIKNPTTMRDVTLNPGEVVVSLVARPGVGRISIDLVRVARNKGLLPDDASGMANEDIKLALVEALRIFNALWEQTPPAPSQVQPSAVVPDFSVLFTNKSVTGCNAVSSSAGDDEALFASLPVAVFHARMAMSKDGTEPEQVNVVVADSGFSAMQATADNPYLHSLRFDGTVDFPLTQFDAVTAAHGTAVTGVALGGPSAWPVAKALNLPITTRAIRIYERDLVDPNRFAPDMRRIARAMNGPPDVVNLSIGERRNLFGEPGLIHQALDDYFDDDGGPLFVIAAGNNGANDNPNGGSDVMAIGLYPQREGNIATNRLIVVGASDGPRRAVFSNSSRSAVSILAPGCGVDSWKADPASGRYAVDRFDGTSFSAPLVTYVASLVYSLAPRDFRSSSRVKARILAASDLREEFLDDVPDGRYLNPTKAVSLYHDVVEREVVVDGQSRKELLFGEFRQQDVRLSRFCESGFVDGNRLLKIARTPQPDDGDTLIYYTWSEDAGLNSGTCNPRPSISFTIDGETSSKNLPIASLVDIVFKWRAQ